MSDNDSTTRGRVLLLDDDRTFGRLLALAVTAGGWSVDVATNRDQALALLQGGEPFSAAICDYELGYGFTGVRVALELLSIDPKLRTMIISGHREEVIRSEPGTRAFGFLQKPFDLQELLDWLQHPTESVAGS